MTTERSQPGVCLLPPSHPLVDRLQRKKGVGELVISEAPPAELQELLSHVGALCQRGGDVLGRHLLGPLAREAGQLLQLHPHCAALAQCDEEAQAAARQAAEQATAALKLLRESLQVSLGPAVEAAKVAAVQQRLTHKGQEQEQQRVATHRGTSYQGFLLYLREHRQRIRGEQPAATSRAVEKAAAQEWKALEAEAKRQMTERAAAILRSKHPTSPSSTLADISATSVANGGAPPALSGGLVLAADGTPTKGGEGRRGKGRQKPPCQVCGEADSRDCVTCTICGARCHLMCFFPPWEQVGKGERWKCTACACAPPPPICEVVPAVGEELEVEVQEANGMVMWKPAVVRKLKPRGRFVVCVNGEDDFIEEYGLQELGREWKRPPATVERLEAEREERGPAAVEAAAQVAQLETRLALDAQPVGSEQLAKVEELAREGFVEAGCGISEEQVELCFDVVSKGYEQYMHAVKTLDLQAPPPSRPAPRC